MKSLTPVNVVALIFLLLFPNCSKSVNSDKLSDTIVQIPGCNTVAFLKSTLSDSCLSYQFKDDLSVDFCASANCCPDSNRFSIKHEIRNDTIEVIIADTAAQMCRCNCNYLLHAEFHDLKLTEYLFQVKRKDYSSHVLLYSVTVKK